MSIMLTTAVLAPAHASDVVLVDNGQPAATIVIPDKPHPVAGGRRTYWVGMNGYGGEPVPTKMPATVEYAALFLQDYLERISGAVLPIVHESEAPAVGTLVLIGQCAKSAEWGIDLARLKPEGFHIKTAPRGMAIAGEIAPEGNFAAGHDRGTLFGVFELLERIGVRWYFPGEIGTIVPEMKTVVIPQMDFSDAPFLWLRAGGTTDSAARWNPCLRMGGSSRLFVCHTPFFWRKFFGEDHPEYFTMRPDGTRNITAGHGTVVQNHLCYSEPGVLRQELLNIEGYLKEGKTRAYWGDMQTLLDPNEIYSYHCPNDIMNVRGECYCLDCMRVRRHDHFGAKHSEIVHGFNARLAEAIAEKWPGRRLVVATGYDSYQWPPLTVDWPENLDIMHMIMRGPQMQVNPFIWDEEARTFRSWQERVGNDRRRMAVWLYYAYPEMFTAAPVLAPDTLSRWYKTYAPHISGVFNNGLKGLNARRTYPMVYLSGRLQWDPNADVRAILDEFYRLSFGPAEKPMAAFFNHLIDCWENARWSEIPPSVEVPNRLIYKDIYRPSDIVKLKQHLEEAVTAAGDDTIYRQRVDWWMEGHQAFFDEARQFHAWLDHLPEWPATLFAASPPLEGGVVWEESQPWKLVGLTKGDSPELATTIRVGYDANYFYFLARAQATNMPSIAPVAQDAEDTDILAGDSIALQLWAGRGGMLAMPSFHEIRVNPAGTVATAVVIEPAFYDGFHHSDRFVWPVKGIRTASTLRDEEWVVGIALPWSAIPEWKDAVPPPRIRLQVERRAPESAMKRMVLSPILGMSYEYPLNRFGVVTTTGK